MEMSSDTYHEQQSDASVEETVGEVVELSTDQGKPHCIPISQDTIRIKWETLPDKFKVIEVQYKPLDSEKWSTVQLRDEECTLDIKGLVEDIYFHFRVKLLYDNQLFFSKISDPVSTLTEEQVNSTNLKSSNANNGIKHTRPADDNSTDKSEAEVYIPPTIAPKAAIYSMERPECEVLNSGVIKVTWEPSPNDKYDLQYYEVRYKNVSEEIKRWESISTKSNDCSITISDLDDKKGYYFKVRAIYDDVEGPFTETSRPISISSALPVQLENQPYELRITERTSQSFHLKWGLPQKTSAEIDCYEMKLKKNNPDVKRWQSNWTKANETEIVINDLDDNTEYIFKVRAMVDGDDGPFSEDLIGRTNPKDNRPLRPRKIASTPHSISFSWGDTSDTTKGSCTQFDIRYRPRNSGKRWFDDLVDSSQTHHTINGLDPNTQYEVKIREVHSELEGPFSGTSQISTEALNYESTGDLDLVIKSTDETSIALTWKQPVEDVGKIDHFEIRYKEGNKKWCTLMIGNNENSHILDGLVSSTLYEVKMRSVVDGVDGPFSIQKVMTKAKLPIEPFVNVSKPNHLVLVKATTDSIEVKWDPPVYEPKSIMHYEIRCKSRCENREELKTSHTEECTLKIHNLVSATEYEIKIRAIYSEKDGTFSDPLVISTKQINVDVIVLEEQEVSYEYISLVWEKPKGDKEADTYHINYRQYPTGKWIPLSTEETQITISDLLEGTNYEFRIRAMFDDTEGPASQSKFIVTLKEPDHVKNQRPAVPKQVDVSFDHISIEWEAPVDCSELCYYETKYSAHLTDKWSVQTSKDNKTTLLGLDPSTLYDVKVRGVYDGNLGPFSDVGEVCTVSEDEVHKNVPPTLPEVVSIGYCFAKLKWSDSDLWRKEIDHYELEYVRKHDIEKEGFQTIRFESFQNEMSLQPLDLATEYKFRVRGFFTDNSTTPFSKWGDFISTYQCIIKALKVSVITHDSLTLSWERPFSHDEIEEYEVMYRENLDGIEEWSMTKTTENQVLVSQLKDSTEYDLKIRCTLNLGKKGDWFDLIPHPTTKLHPEKKYPGMPHICESTTRTISLTWSPCKLRGIGGHEIKYRECGTETRKWMSVTTDSTSTAHTVSDLRNGTDYEFKVAAIINGETGQFSQLSHKIPTKLSLARKLQLDAQLLVDTGLLKKYKLPVVCTSENKAAKTRKCEIDQRLLREHKDPTKPLQKAGKFLRKVNDFVHLRRPFGRNEKTVMLVGATGSGKSTLIDGMINYVTDVSWEDDFRFTLVDLTEEEEKKREDQTVSQTDWITTYRIPCFNGGKLDYTVNIVDTPGFGDTRGVTRDKELVSQLKDLFESKDENGIQMLDGVCFVTPSANARLTTSQRYIFDSMLALFGKDIADNIFILITFADCKEPPVLGALDKAEVPFTFHYKFNNSALFQSNMSQGDFSKMFWKMGENSFETFFMRVRGVDPKSLQLTADVLRTRSLLEVTIEGIQKQVVVGMNQLNTIRQEGEVLKRHKDDISNNKNFSYEVEEAVMVEVKLNAGVYVTNCLNCNLSCHFPCRIKKDEDKSRCKAMGGTNCCTVCPKKCHWSKHRNASFRLDAVKQSVSKTYEELKKKFEIAKKEATNQETVLHKVKAKFVRLRREVNDEIKSVRKYINDLDQFALRPNPLSDVDYIDLLITSEEHDMKYDWENRVKLLKDFRSEAQMVKDVKEGMLEPFKGTDDVLRSFDINFH